VGKEIALKLEIIRKRFIPMSETMFFILLSLQEERHGYGIMQHVKELTKNRIVLGAGTIYKSQSKLEGDGLIVSTREIDRKKLYLITEVGWLILKEEAMRIKEIYQIVERLL